MSTLAAKELIQDMSSSRSDSRIPHRWLPKYGSGWDEYVTSPVSLTFECTDFVREIFVPTILPLVLGFGEWSSKQAL